MPQDLTDSRKIEIQNAIRMGAEKQLSETDVGSRLGFAPEEFQIFLSDYPEYRRQFVISRYKGQGDLKEILYQKAMSEKNMDAIRFLAAEHLGMGLKDQQEKTLQKIDLSDDQLKAIHDIYFSKPA